MGSLDDDILFQWVGVTVDSFSQIYVTNEYLSITTDQCLQSAIMHEYGHLKQRRVMVAIILISLVVFLQLVLLLPVNLLLVWTPCTYLWFCYLCRLGEYHADE